MGHDCVMMMMMMMTMMMMMMMMMMMLPCKMRRPCTYLGHHQRICNGPQSESSFGTPAEETCDGHCQLSQVLQRRCRCRPMLLLVVVVVVVLLLLLLLLLAIAMVMIDEASP